MKRTSSIVWQFFDKIEENKRCVAVVCRLCDTEYKFFGNTTNLRVHLIKKHPLQWKLRNDFQRPEVSETSNVEDNDEDSTVTTPRAKRIKSSKSSEGYVERFVIANDNQDEDHEASENLVQINNFASDEEWLEEALEENHNVMIKRELHSPPRTRSIYVQGRPKKERQTVTVKPTPQREHDEYTVFGEYIASKLRKIKTPRARGNIQQIITTILWQADYGLYDDAEAVRKVIMCNVDTPRPSVSSVNNEESVCNNSNFNSDETSEKPVQVQVQITSALESL